jgi:hypothetical protein
MTARPDKITAEFYPDWYDGPVQAVDIKPEIQNLQIEDLVGYVVGDVEVTQKGNLVFTFERVRKQS